jgi:hypothetical protein
MKQKHNKAELGEPSFAFLFFMAHARAALSVPFK